MNEEKINIRDYVQEKFDLPPFIIELLDRENMFRYWCLILLNEQKMINSLEEKVKQGEIYENLTGYYLGNQKTFSIKEGDKIVLDLIANDLRTRAHNEFSSGVVSTNQPKSSGYTLLDLLNTHFYQNKTLYHEEIKKICLLLYLKGGPSLYGYLSSILPIPSLSSVKRYIGNIQNIDEGVVRATELKTHLVTNNYPLKVWLSEDATRCIGNVEYDTSSEKFVGFTLPYNDNGLPNTSKFQNISAPELKVSFAENPLSQYIYCIMAKPLTSNSSSFCLCAYGTDNKFKTNDVRKRVQTIEDMLKEVGISVLGISSDGDSRLLKYMKIVSGIGDTPEYQEESQLFKNFFYGDISPHIFTIQDPLHIVTKLRNLIAKPSTHLQVGHLIISTSFLISLINEKQRGEHNLVMTDVKVKDRMNVKSAIKLFDEKVMRHLRTKETLGLYFYLKIMKSVYVPFHNDNLSHREVIYHIWFAAIALKYWRNIQGANFFISSNAYTCVQINAHSLLALYRKLRDEKQLDFFIPTIFNSQTCENFFRLARSFTTTQSTVINFSINQFLHRLKRIEIAEKLQNQFNLKDKQTVVHVQHEILSDVDIESLLNEVNDAVLTDFKHMEIEINNNDNIKLHIKRERIGTIIKDEDEMYEDDTEIDVEQVSGVDVVPVSTFIEVSDSEASEEENVHMEIDDEAIIHDATGLLERSIGPLKKGYFRLKTSRDEEFDIKKGTLCYLYQKRENVSNDRLFRFRTSSSIDDIDENEDGLKTNDFVLMKNVRNVCRIVQFKILNTRRKKDSEYFSESVSFTHKDYNRIGALCSFYKYKLKDNQLFLELSKELPFYIPLSEFLYKLPCPNASNNNYSYDSSVSSTLFNKIREKLG